jgi:hypothetical protein
MAIRGRTAGRKDRSNLFACILHHGCKLAILIIVGAFGGCGVFDSDSAGGTGGEGGGTLAPQCAPDDRPWFLHCPEAQTVQPGQMIELEVDRVDLPTSELFLWIGEEELIIPIFTIVPSDPQNEEGRYTLTTPVPALDEGILRVAVGTADGQSSNVVELLVKHPAPRYTQVEAAEVLHEGLDGLIRQTRLLVGDDSEEWQQFLTETYRAEDLEHVATLMSELEVVSDMVQDSYLALSPEQERIAQSYLSGSGLLDGFEALALTPDVTTTSLGTRNYDWVKGAAVHRVLFQLDVTSFAIHSFGIAVDVVTLIAAFLPGTQPIAALGVGTKVAIAAIKYIIDTFLPTDLMALEVHGQPFVFHEEPTVWVYWGTFAPQNGAVGALRSLDSIVVEGVIAALPSTGKGIIPKEKVKDFVKEFLIKAIASIVAERGSSVLGSEYDVPVYTIKTPIDINIYGNQLLTLLHATPGIQSAVKKIQWVLYWLDVLWGVNIQTASPTWAGEPTLTSFMMSLTVGGIPYPSPAATEQAVVGIQASGFRFTSKERYVSTLPSYETVEPSVFATTVQQGPDPANANQLSSDERYVILKVPTTGGLPFPWVTPETPRTRSTTLRMSNFNGFVGPASVDVYVNEVLQHSGLEPPLINFATYPLELEPGLNRVRIVNMNPNPKSCSSGAASGSGCLVVGFPDAINPDSQTTFVAGATADGSRTFEVWTPPAFDAP